MLKDSQYQASPFHLLEKEHAYGPNVHLLNDPWAFSQLAKLSEPRCEQPEFNTLLCNLYQHLVRKVISHAFAQKTKKIQTRMAEFHPKEGAFEAPVLEEDGSAVVVSLARAGLLPSQICFEELQRVFKPKNVRQDHIFINRKTDSADQVIGCNMAGSKIGGPIDDSYVLIPDPMGATGSTVHATLDHMDKYGKPKKFLLLHLILTPEYLQSVHKHHDAVEIYAYRLDRGLSSAKVLSSSLGAYWTEEKGLNQKHYIVPGAGGLGELINNAFV